MYICIFVYIYMSVVSLCFSCIVLLLNVLKSIRGANTLGLGERGGTLPHFNIGVECGLLKVPSIGSGGYTV